LVGFIVGACATLASEKDHRPMSVIAEAPNQVSARTRTKSLPALPALTSLRFFAALYVVVFHGGQQFFTSEIGKSFAGAGYVAVDLFFVLSGFVLTYRYCTEDGELAATKRSFWVARVARVYPIYVLGFVSAAPRYISGQLRTHTIADTIGHSIPSAAATLLLLQAWFYGTATNWNNPGWSLSVEAFLYLAFPFVMTPLVRLLSVRRALGIAVVSGALWLVAIIPPLLYLGTNPDGISPVTAASHGPWIDTLRFMPIFHLASFMLGIVAGWAHLHRRNARQPPWLGTISVSAVIVVLCAARWLPYPLLHSGLLAPLFAALVYCVAGDHGPITRVLENRTLVALGDASYALYLLHYPILAALRHFVGRELTLFEFAVLCVGLQPLCLVLYRYVETPARDLIRTKLA
jgi:peptidoglycan/LPS O-acetylase OafA/YrhL